MTVFRAAGYAPFVMNGWQHIGAFVLQFQAQTDVNARQFKGRVEHVASSQAAHFESLDELLSFLDRMLNEARTKYQAQD
jgi:hypothetical protein